MKEKIIRFWDEALRHAQDSKDEFIAIIALGLFVLGLYLGAEITERRYEIKAELGTDPIFRTEKMVQSPD